VTRFILNLSTELFLNYFTGAGFYYSTTGFTSIFCLISASGFDSYSRLGSDTILAGLSSTSIVFVDSTTFGLTSIISSSESAFY